MMFSLKQFFNRISFSSGTLFTLRDKCLFVVQGLAALCWVTIGVVVESNGPQWLPKSAYTNIGI